MVELADENAKYLGLSREIFQTSCGMATAFFGRRMKFMAEEYSM